MSTPPPTRFAPVRAVARGSRAGKLFVFLAAGVPAAGIAMLVNWVGVRALGWHPYLVYALALASQLTVNYWACRLVVFDIDHSESVWRQYIRYIGAASTLRLADWVVCCLLLYFFGLHYLLAQAVNIVGFSVLRLSWMESIFERRRAARAATEAE